MATKYCTHYACRLAHTRKEGERRASRQRDTHAGKSPCVLAELHAAKVDFAGCLYNKMDPAVLRKKVELNRLYGKFLCD